MPLFTSDLELSDDYPTIEPSLRLDFANARALDPRITFTRASVATYVDRDRLIKTAGEDEARFDHDPATGESLGLLIEDSRTNDITQSNASNWSNAGVSKSTNTSEDVSPEGLNTATIVSESTNNGLHRIKSPNISFSDTRTFSVWIKRNSGTRDIYINANAIMGAGLNFNFDTETLGSTTGTASFERYPNQWYRFVLTGTGTGGTNGVYIQFTQSGNEGDDNYVGVASNKFLLWGAQLEVGSFVTSHIPTSGASATRAKDDARISGANLESWINKNEGTWLIDFRLLGAGAGLLSISGTGASVNERYMMWNIATDEQIGAAVVDGGVIQTVINITFTPGQTTQFTKAIFAVKVNDFAITANGLTPVTDNSGTVYNSPTQLRFAYGNGTNTPYAHFKTCIYYPKRLPNTQLQTLTQ